MWLQVSTFYIVTSTMPMQMDCLLQTMIRFSKSTKLYIMLFIWKPSFEMVGVEIVVCNLSTRIFNYGIYISGRTIIHKSYIMT